MPKTKALKLRVAARCGHEHAIADVYVILTTTILTGQFQCSHDLDFALILRCDCSMKT